MAICPPKNQPKNDVVMTPPDLAQTLVDHIKPHGVCLDPARGDGAFYNAMKPYADELHYCEITEGKDFLTADLPPVDWIVTNPPWSILREFMERSFEVANNVALLATVTNFVTRKRLELTFSAGFVLTDFLMVKRPETWSPTGFQVAMAVFKKAPERQTTWTYL